MTETINPITILSALIIYVDHIPYDSLNLAGDLTLNLLTGNQQTGLQISHIGCEIHANNKQL